MRYDQFVQNYPDGKIPKDAFISMLEGAYKSSKRMSKIQAQGYENYAFKTYDLNGDGCIDFKEFLWVMYTLSDDSPRQKLELIFKTFDDNRDGIISSNEMKQVVKDFFYLLNNPEMINWDEMSARIFTEMDINEDNKITKEEFIQACLRNNTVSEMLAKKILKVISTDVS